MEEEIRGQTENGNWEIITRDQLPEGSRVLPADWTMRRKQRVLDGFIYKWKARLNIDGGKQLHGLDYWETYAPVASWSTIRTILIIALTNQWHVQQIDFVQA
jgi:Reverse transcriptase (RNA-dependent DNA polymerase)